MNEVQEFILKRAMQKVANGDQVDIDPRAVAAIGGLPASIAYQTARRTSPKKPNSFFENIRNSYNKATDYLADKMYGTRLAPAPAPFTGHLRPDGTVASPSDPIRVNDYIRDTQGDYYQPSDRVWANVGTPTIENYGNTLLDMASDARRGNTNLPAYRQPLTAQADKLDSMVMDTHDNNLLVDVMRRNPNGFGIPALQADPRSIPGVVGSIGYLRRVHENPDIYDPKYYGL